MVVHFRIMCLFTIIIIIAAMGTTTTLQAAGSNYSSSIAKPGCPAKCGDVTVPYPFGVGMNCSLDYDFYLICNTSSDSRHKTSQLFHGPSETRIHSISSDSSEVRLFTGVAYKCYHQDGNVSSERSYSSDLRGIYSIFGFSENNNFTVIGCDDVYGFYRDIDNTIQVSCNTPSMMYHRACGAAPYCTRDVSLKDASIRDASITVGLGNYNLTFKSDQNHTGDPCGYAFLGEHGSYGVRDLSNNASSSEVVERIESTVPVVLDWSIPRSYPYHVCQENSERYGVEMGGYRCRCIKGYQGNAYLEHGCQDINECDVNGNISCYGNCTNTAGSYNCTCWPGYTGDAKTQDGCQPIANGSKFPVTIFTLALVFGLVAILSGVIGIFFGIRKRKLIKLREKFFEQNGGVFLKQKLNAPGTGESVTMFTTEQLRKATDNYSEDQIIGHGGYGVVYKGILPDNRVVAVKKSKLVDKTQAEQFINEVLILTQVIHRNVVKLLGCCLEEQIPVLVYEFISNNTLFYHIHHRSGGTSWLSWENRLRVATEAASALGYLHSQASMPIIHRDVKSTNILLDDNYTTKISDFGASRLVPLDHDQVTTLVQGTLGYLDPEYFHTSQLTDKSDVYSFGVVLAELITGLKPLGADRTDNEKNLATYFVMAVKESRLFEIVEPRVLREGTLEQLQAVGDLVKRCLSLHGNDRPTMKEVAMELEGLKRFKTHPWSQNQTHEESRSLILQVEQSDLDDVPSIPYGTSELESSFSTSMRFQESEHDFFTLG